MAPIVAAVAVLLLTVGGGPARADHSTDLHSPNMVHVADDKNDDPPTSGAINSDLAFWGNIAAAGNYRGLRLFDIRKPERPLLLTAFRCNGGQGDVSFYQAKERLLLIQSVDAPQDNRSCRATARGPSGENVALRTYRRVGIGCLRWLPCPSSRSPSRNEEWAARGPRRSPAGTG